MVESEEILAFLSSSSRIVKKVSEYGVSAKKRMIWQLMFIDEPRTRPKEPSDGPQPFSVLSSVCLSVPRAMELLV
jgi:hypothetical protein